MSRGVPPKRRAARPGGKPPSAWSTLPLNLLLHLPTGYRDLRSVYTRGGKKDLTCMKVRISSVSVVGHGRKHLLVKARGAEDGKAVALRFFNYNQNMQRWLKSLEGATISGEASDSGQTLEFVHPRIIDPKQTSEGGPAAMYQKVEGISEVRLRNMISKALRSADLSDTIPQDILRRHKLPTLKEALLSYHRPQTEDVEALLAGTHPASAHLKFSEWLAHQLLMRRNYRAGKAHKAVPISDTGIGERIVKSLPFALTGGQEEVRRHIGEDLAGPAPMRRLLHGDVGSGKTVIAGLACAMVADNGLLAAFMAPTELLAEQHFSTLQPLLEPAGISCRLLTGSTRPAQRREIEHATRRSGRLVLFGTHALFQEKVELAQLGLVVIDEQHRFGVIQRNSLVKKAKGVHQLMLSATPIPRTLSIALFADLDVSALKEKPPGRMPVHTKIFRSGKRAHILRLIRSELGGQVYWVCPLVQDSEKQNLLSAETLFERVREEFPEIRTGLVHGRMTAAEKAAVIARFKAGELRMIVATTVVEVGIDAPTADVMVIEHAERMGLSQMHQLRGRVGRADRPGYCLLLYSGNLSKSASQRMRVMRDTNDGFKIANEDLKMRGIGEWLGLSQSGMKLRFADPLQDSGLAEMALHAAKEMVARGGRDVQAHVSRWFGLKDA